MKKRFKTFGAILGVLVLIAALLVSGGCATAPESTPPPAGDQQPTASSGEAPSEQGDPAQRDYILIGRPNPTTGPLAGFGEGTPWGEERALEAINKDGGVFIKDLNKKLPIKIKVVDTESNPTKAAEVASKLILDDKVDMMMPMHTPDTVNPVSATCERYQVPCVSLDAPVEAWLTGGPYEWGYHAHWRVDTISDLYISMFEQAIAKDPSIKKNVGYLFPNDPDGKSWSEIFNTKLAAKGFKVVDPGRFPYNTKDYSSMVSQFKAEECDIICGCLIGPDFATAWRQMKQQGFVPKVAVIGKAMLFPSDAIALGDDLAQAISTEIWWSPNHPFKSSITGETAQEFGEAWVKESGKQWSQPLGYKYASMELAYDIFTRAGSLDKNKIKEAIEQTNLPTMIGTIKYTADHYAETPLVGGQWVKGEEWPWEIYAINNEYAPEIPTGAEMIVPIPQ